MITAGLGFKLDHLDDALGARVQGLWFEVHAENYLVDEGPRLAALTALRACHPVSLHGLGLSIVAAAPPADDYLKKLRRLVERISPVRISDHLTWQRWVGAHHSDFLPFPRTRETLDHAAGNLMRVQDALGRQILIENPSLYVDLPRHEMHEVDFLAELAVRSGCGLLVDVNNIFVGASNLGFEAEAYIDAVPPELVGEIHLAGHSRDGDPASPLFIDSHDTPVSDAVWRLYRRLLARTGCQATLIERDRDVPPFAELLVERETAHALMTAGEFA